MTDLSQQTELLLKAFNTLHNDFKVVQLDLAIIATLLLAILLVVIFRKRP